MCRFSGPEEVVGIPEAKDALIELLLQLADDDLLTAHRASEWLGLAPHIEEDVAFSSIAQNTMGHALHWFGLLEPLTRKSVDDLAYLRPRGGYRQAILVERPNGPGLYLVNPEYDWGYTVVRQLVYETFKRERLEGLKRSSYAPLAAAAEKILDEQFYHLFHWETWWTELGQSTAEARRRLSEATAKVFEDLLTLFDLGPRGASIVRFGFAPSAETTAEATLSALKTMFEKIDLPFPPLGTPPFTGREGRHTDEGWAALEWMGEVYRLAPEGKW